MLGFGPCTAVVFADESSASAWAGGGQVGLLDDAIDRYTAIVADGGWPEVPPGPELSAGVRDPVVRVVRQRLRLSGDFEGEVAADPILFDLNLTRALMRFQARHGLDATGILDRLTRQVLAQPAEQRLAELRYARDAWRRVPLLPQGRVVWVNIPEARVVAVRDGQVDLNLRSIVGKADRPTPEVSSELRRVVVNPPWRVPRSIAVRDLLPRQQANPDFFRSQHIRVLGTSGAEVEPTDVDWATLGEDRFPYRLVQDPGPWNALGAYKFDFPNDDDVYLHDTPAPLLLDLSFRSFSSGCVRVDEATAFARWLLESDARIDVGHRRETRYEILAAPVPLHLVYLPAWVTSDGRVQFRADLYGRVGNAAVLTE